MAQTESIPFTTSRDGNGVLHYTPQLSITVNDWREAQMRFPRDKDALSVWAIFEKPSDNPDGYVVRESVSVALRVVTSPFAMYATSLEDARSKLPPGLKRLPRQPADPQFLVESWL